MDLFTTISYLLPEEWSKKANKLMREAGRSITGRRFVGFWALMIVFLTIIFTTVLFFVEPFSTFTFKLSHSIHPLYVDVLKVITSLVIGFLLAMVVFFMAYSYNSLLADARREAVDSVLPDFLILVSSNMRAGMTLDQAMWNSAKPEFGILSEEIRKAIKESFSGKPLEDALDEIKKATRSALLYRVVEMLKQAIKSGGEIAKILERTSQEAMEIYISKKEIKSSLIVYVIFLIFSASFGVPFLLAVSMKMLEVLYEAFSITQAQVTPETFSLLGGFTLGRPPVTPEEFYYFSLMVIFITDFMTSFLIGSAYSGNRNEGLKYFPVMLFLSYGIFFLSLNILNAFFGGV